MTFGFFPTTVKSLLAHCVPHDRARSRILSRRTGKGTCFVCTFGVETTGAELFLALCRPPTLLSRRCRRFLCSYAFTPSHPSVRLALQGIFGAWLVLWRLCYSLRPICRLPGRLMIFVTRYEAFSWPCGYVTERSNRVSHTPNQALFAKVVL